MRMNNKGFAVSGILYTILIIFMVSMVTLLFNLQNRKTILDELKTDVVDAVESDNNYEYLLNEINELKAQIGSTNIDDTITSNINILNNNTTWKKIDVDYSFTTVDLSWKSIGKYSEIKEATQVVALLSNGIENYSISFVKSSLQCVNSYIYLPNDSTRQFEVDMVVNFNTGAVSGRQSLMGSGSKYMSIVGLMYR